ncbi:MutR [Streptococcus pneumoniae]|nr:MutR [Streptococcus pneumoniae]
MRLGLWTDF